MGRSSDWYPGEGSLDGTVPGTQEEPWSPLEGTTTANLSLGEREPGNKHTGLSSFLSAICYGCFSKSKLSRSQTVGAFLNRIHKSQFSGVLNSVKKEPA